jgi:hypothetical protein
MSATENAEVTVGGRSYRIARFRGFKAQQILRLAARIGREYPALTEKVAAFERDYVEGNKLQLSRPEAELRFGERAVEITEEAWTAADGKFDLKRMPSTWERVAALWPELFDAAERPVTELLAVISLSNEELADADEADDVQGVITKRRRELFRDGDAEELIELAVAGVEVAKEQFGPLVQRVVPMLMALVGLTTDELPLMGSSTSQDQQDSTDSSPTSSDSETSPSSSTDSPPPTDGPGNRPSDPPGSSSDDSQSG